MPSLSDLLRLRTTLEEADVLWLRLLVAEWRLLADLAFSDLQMFVQTRDGGTLLAVAAQRPTTGPTSLVDDPVGQELAPEGRPLVAAAFADGQRHRQGDPEWSDDIPVRVEAIPVRRAGRVIAVVLRTASLISVRMPSRLEVAYQDAAAGLTRMMTEGRFPSPDLVAEGDVPRVGDGFVRLDANGAVTYASPNAVSSYRGLGLVGDLLGTALGEVTAELAPTGEATHESLTSALSGRVPRSLEVRAPGSVLAVRVIPLTYGQQHHGAIVLVRDVTDVRQREQQLLTKDATIREIHHRVKNNLQAVAALLRLQSRRVSSPEAQAALGDAHRRIGAIALVHDMLASTHGGPVDFDEVVDRLLHVVPEMAAPGESFDVRREGSVGSLPADHATGLAMAVTELVTNAAQHGFPATRERGEAPRIEVALARHSDRLHLEVRDNGVGMSGPPPTTSLGLGIAQSVLGDLDGDLSFEPARPCGVLARVSISVPGDTSSGRGEDAETDRGAKAAAMMRGDASSSTEGVGA